MGEHLVGNEKKSGSRLETSSCRIIPKSRISFRRTDERTPMKRVTGETQNFNGSCFWFDSSDFLETGEREIAIRIENTFYDFIQLRDWIITLGSLYSRLQFALFEFQFNHSCFSPLHPGLPPSVSNRYAVLPRTPREWLPELSSQSILTIPLPREKSEGTSY